jgi:hypothetical protein
MFVRRLGPTQSEPALPCSSTYGCPDIWELEGGDFAVIGTDITGHADKLPTTAGCGPDERIVKIGREILIRAKPYIPDSV